jgi:mono/diheme cytochrome c family protein
LKRSTRPPSWRWNINRARITSAALLLGVGLLAGCRQDMQDQPKFTPQRGTTFYEDGRSARPQVAGTVARGQLHADSYFYTGLQGGKEQNALPFPVTLAVLERGQERFNVYCTPCHSRVGNGVGMIVQRGYKPAGNLHDPVRLAQPLSHYFTVMTNGYGAMPDYSAQLTPEDRWAVAAYIRALQLSQNAKAGDVPSGAHVQQLKDIADQQGYPADFAMPWGLPATGINAMPSTGIYGNAVGTAQPEPSAPIDAAINAGHPASNANQQKTDKQSQPGRTDEKQTQWEPLRP